MDVVSMIMGLAAGLGFFLYGMNLMSDGLEEAAGSKMKSILSMCTKNRFVGVIVGALFTAVIQSSSAATVMIVSFVNSGLMTLMQAVGPIMGANIGTTITGQLVSLKLDAVAPVFIITGVIMLSFCKKQTVKNIGKVVLGFGILFFGMATMSDAMRPLRDADGFKNVIMQLENPILAVLAGFVFTAIIQSSSASTGIIITMASAGLITMEHTMVVIYLILGCNIGTCVSALLASINGKKNAKRAAFVHLVINILGTIVVGLLYIPLQEFILDLLFKISGGRSDASMARFVANVNTLFKVVQIILLFPFAKYIVKITHWIVRGEDKKTTGFELQYLNVSADKTPAAAIMEVDMEIKHMGQVALTNLRESFDVLINPDKEKIEEVLQREKEVDFYSAEITDYMVKLTQENLPSRLAKNMAGYFHVVSDIERIGDHAENLAEFSRTRMDEDIQFSDVAVDELRNMFEKVEKTVEYALETFTEQKEEYLAEIVALEKEVDVLEKELEHNHVKRLSKNLCTSSAAIFTDVVSNLERVSDHATNIAFAIYDEEQYGAD